MSNPIDVLPPSVNQTEPPKAVRLKGDPYARRAHLRRDAGKAIAYTAQVVAPALARKAADMSVPDAELRPAERAARQIRQELLAELVAAGADTPGARHILDTCVVSILICNTCDDYVMRLLNDGGLVNRRTHQTYPLVDTMTRLHKSLASRLRLLQLHKEHKKAPKSTGEWLSSTEWALSRQIVDTAGSGAGTHGAQPKPKTPKRKQGQHGGPKIGRRQTDQAGAKQPGPGPTPVTRSEIFDSNFSADRNVPPPNDHPQESK